MVALFGGLQATLGSSGAPPTGANRAATRRFDPPWLGFRRDSEVDAPPIEVAIILALMVMVGTGWRWWRRHKIFFTSPNHT